jgi:hypothetical protein
MTTPQPRPRKVKMDMSITAADLTRRVPRRYRATHDPALCDLTKCPVCVRKITMIQSMIRRSAPSRVKHRINSGAWRRVTHRDTRFEVVSLSHLKERAERMSDSGFHWSVVILLVAIFAAIMGATRGIDASLKVLFQKLDSIIQKRN